MLLCCVVTLRVFLQQSISLVRGVRAASFLEHDLINLRWLRNVDLAVFALEYGSIGRGHVVFLV